MIHFGEDIEAILRRLPVVGSLFPYLQSVRAGDRATEFKQRCVGLGIKGVSLHSYRYAWAERAKQCGLPGAVRARGSRSQQQGGASCLRAQGQGEVAVFGKLRTAGHGRTDHPVAVAFVGEPARPFRSERRLNRLFPFVPRSQLRLRAFRSRQYSQIASLARASHFSSRRSCSSAWVAKNFVALRAG